jgi:hypothetical protein
MDVRAAVQYQGAEAMPVWEPNEVPGHKAVRFDLNWRATERNAWNQRLFDK